MLSFVQWKFSKQLTRHSQISVKYWGRICHPDLYSVPYWVKRAPKHDTDACGVRMSSTASSTEHYIFDYFGPNSRLFDWVRLSWTTNATSQCHKRYAIAKPIRNLHILMTVVVKWNIASLGHFISNIHFTAALINIWSYLMGLAIAYLLWHLEVLLVVQLSRTQSNSRIFGPK